MSIHIITQQPSYRRRVVIVLISVLCFTLLFPCLLAQPLERWYTYRLGPPPYPGAVVLSQQEGAGTGGVRETTLYTTPDDIVAVHAFMQQHMPGFTGSPDTGFSNQACASNVVADMIDHLLVSYPFDRCVAVEIYRETSTSNATVIRVVAQWADG